MLDRCQISCVCVYTHCWCVCSPVEPTVTLDVSAQDLMNCRAGTTIRIPATITGRPVPKVTWTFDGTAETEKKNDLHTLPVDSEVRAFPLHCWDSV